LAIRVERTICAPAARLIQIPLASALALPMGWAHSGVFWGVFVSETEGGVFTLWLFSRGRWKTVKV
jgi:Na+-driven multidrug efflux pump